MECLLEKAAVKAFKDAIHNPYAKIDSHKYSYELLTNTSFSASDGTVLNGLVWNAKNPVGYVMVVQGTSMLAAEIYENFKPLTELGLDVFIYDFRGYGRSKETTTLQGIINDYTEIIKSLNSNPKYKYQYYYGMSFGGVILTLVLAQTELKSTAMVLDSTPHAVPWYLGCPVGLDPINNIPKDCSNWLVISGADDRVIGSRATKFMDAAKQACGAKTFSVTSGGHIFMDNQQSTESRLKATNDFFAKQNFK